MHEIISFIRFVLVLGTALVGAYITAVMVTTTYEYLASREDEEEKKRGGLTPTENSPPYALNLIEVRFLSLGLKNSHAA